MVQSEAGLLSVTGYTGSSLVALPLGVLADGMPRIEVGLPTICSETCVGRLRYIGLVLYDADKVLDAASVVDDRELLAAQRSVFLDPHDPAVVRAAEAAGIERDWIDAAQRSPVWALINRYEVALPLHPEYRTVPRPVCPTRARCGRRTSPRYALVALAGSGWATQVDRFPDPENVDHLAHIRPLAENPPADAARLAGAIPRRHTDRRRFSADTVDHGLLKILVECAATWGTELHVVAGGAARRRLLETITRSASLQKQQEGYAAELAR